MRYSNEQFELSRSRSRSSSPPEEVKEMIVQPQAQPVEYLAGLEIICSENGSQEQQPAQPVGQPDTQAGQQLLVQQEEAIIPIQEYYANGMQLISRPETGRIGATNRPGLRSGQQLHTMGMRRQPRTN